MACFIAAFDRFVLAMSARRSFRLSAIALCAFACTDRGAPPAPGSASAPPAGAAASGAVLPAADDTPTAMASSSASAAADPIVAIPAGRHVLGSTPGDRGRDPTLEPPGIDADMRAYDIDRYLFPNELGSPPLTGVTRKEAQAKCAERGRRLCTEAEWERACKGASNDPFPGGPGFRDACRDDPKTCASGFGVLAMGSMREWTAGDIEAVGDVKGGAAVRGAPRSAGEQDKRCAKRTPVDAGSGADDMGFRCCGGDAVVVPFPKPTEAAPFEATDLAGERLAQILRAVPQLAKLSGDPKYFDEAGAVRDVTARADAGTPDGYKLTTAPLLWRPVLGEEVVVVAVQVGVDSLVAAFHKLPGDRLRVASTLVLKKDAGPVVLAYDRSAPRRLEWSTCWGCRGESGRITYRDDRRVVITQE
jgi:hypothetical protein